MDTLKSCPFCGGQAALDETVLDMEQQYIVRCRSCMAQGPLAETREAAGRAWNRRRTKDKQRESEA